MPKMIHRAALLLTALILGLLAVPGQAQDYHHGDLIIEQPWARASIGPAKAGAAYLTVVNSGEVPDRLVAVATPAAGHAQVHANVMEDGIMKMRQVDAVEVVPGEPAILKPGGLHIMLMGLKAPLREGERFPLTLTFDKAGEIEVEAVVEAPAAMEPSHGAGGHHGS